MTPRGYPGSRRRRLVGRLWWAAPTALVLGTAVAAAIVVGPTLGEQVSVPRQLAVPDPAVASPLTVPVQPTPARHRPAPAPATHATVAPAAPPAAPAAAVMSTGRPHSTRVVQPRRPVVTASSDDDATERRDGGGDGSGATAQPTSSGSASPSPAPTSQHEQESGH